MISRWSVCIWTMTTSRDARSCVFSHVRATIDLLPSQLMGFESWVTAICLRFCLLSRPTTDGYPTLLLMGFRMIMEAFAISALFVSLMIFLRNRHCFVFFEGMYIPTALLCLHEESRRNQGNRVPCSKRTHVFSVAMCYFVTCYSMLLLVQGWCDHQFESWEVMLMGEAKEGNLFLDDVGWYLFASTHPLVWFYDVTEKNHLPIPPKHIPLTFSLILCLSRKIQLTRKCLPRFVPSFSCHLHLLLGGWWADTLTLILFAAPLPHRFSCEKQNPPWCFCFLTWWVPRGVRRIDFA